MRLKVLLLGSLLLVSGILFFSSCDLDDDVIDLTGSWSGPFTIAGDGVLTLSAEISQSDSNLSGSAALSFQEVTQYTYTISATFDGDNITGTLVGVDVPPEDTYDIAITATTNSDGTQINGTFNIPQSGASGTFSLTKS